MSRLFIWLACFSAIAAGLSVTEATAAMPGPLTKPAVGTRVDVETVTFWARPYPYGYSGWRGCRKHRVRVETPTGWRWRRVCI